MDEHGQGAMWDGVAFHSTGTACLGQLSWGLSPGLGSSVRSEQAGGRGTPGGPHHSSPMDLAVCDPRARLELHALSSDY